MKKKKLNYIHKDHEWKLKDNGEYGQVSENIPRVSSQRPWLKEQELSPSPSDIYLKWLFAVMTKRSIISKNITAWNI